MECIAFRNLREQINRTFWEIRTSIPFKTVKRSICRYVLYLITDQCKIKKYNSKKMQYLRYYRYFTCHVELYNN